MILADRGIAETGSSRKRSFKILNCKVVNKLKKIVLTITSIFMIIIRFLIANDMGQSALRHDDTSITNNILNSKEETFQGVKSNKDSYESDIGYADNDLVFRDYSCGYRLEKGYEILIEQDKIIGEVENTQTIVVFWNDSVYKEFAFDGNDIEFEIDKSGNYSFYAIDSDGNSFDIMSIVKAYKSADGGVMPL